ncbi:3-oxoacyl-[acyl-carrier-protein] synthase I, chloroplastic-like [Bidens hawaiensis]|uniref:3-oxoacyl-[acyl-carrier-protein] synthase I, chloroplastic-like n=1 Tax=Bidens hawaiensis TaxID=980011 RepID=UPI00404A9BB9
MESLEHAMKRDAPIIAEYLGGATNCDACHIISPQPDGFGVTSCIQSCLVNAGVSVEEVNYINAHATSTKAGDVAKMKALKNVFQDSLGIKINYTKVKSTIQNALKVCKDLVLTEENTEAYALANLASALKIPNDIKIPIIHILTPATKENYEIMETSETENDPVSWTRPIIRYLQDNEITREENPRTFRMKETPFMMGLAVAGAAYVGRYGIQASNAFKQHTPPPDAAAYCILTFMPLPVNEKKMPKGGVVVTGMGVVSVFGNDVDTFYQRLLAGESGVGLIDRFNASGFPSRIAGQIHDFESGGYINRKDDQRLDDCQRYCIVAGKKALEYANLGAGELSKTDKTRSGVIVGPAMGCVRVFSDIAETLMERGCNKITPFFTPYVLASMCPASLAIDLGFTGPTYSILAACATSNYCFCAAANHIREGVADLMIAGGVEAPLTPLILAGFGACNALSRRNNDPKTACRPWDQDRDGFVVSEGAGVLVMESLEHAMKRDAPIIAEYLGGARNCDAYHIISPRPDGFGVASCIQSCLVNAGVSVEEVNYINAHATSTWAGDVAEMKALKNVFKDSLGIKINATKSMIGHSFAAAGGMEAIATIKAIQTGWLHPTINQFQLDPEVEFDTVANHKQQHEINVAISNSFGMGGHNSVVAFSAFKP